MDSYGDFSLVCRSLFSMVRRNMSAAGSWKFSLDDLKGPSSLASKLKNPADPVSAYLEARLEASTRAELAAWEAPAIPASALQGALIKDLNAVLIGDSVWDTSRFAGVEIRAVTQRLTKSHPIGEELIRLNRLLLEDAYPLELSRSPKTPLGSLPSWDDRSTTSTLWTVIEFSQGEGEGALDALGQLVERYRPTIRKYLGERLRDFDPENAEATLAHVVLPKLIKRATRRSRKGSFRRLLRLAVHAYVVDRLRESTVETSSWPRVAPSDLIDERDLARRLKNRQGQVAQYLCEHLPVAALRQLDAWDTRDPVQPDLQQALITILDSAVIGPLLWQSSRFAKVSLRPETRTLAEASLPASGTRRLNRLLLEDAFPLALARSKAGTEHTAREVFDSEILDNLLDAEDDDPVQPGDGMDAEFALRTFVEACTRFRGLFLARKSATQAELGFLLAPPERDGQEVGVRELASSLGITPEALKVRRHRAREALRMVFGQCVADIVTRQRLDEEVRILVDLLCRALGSNPFQGLKPPRSRSE